MTTYSASAAFGGAGGIAGGPKAYILSGAVAAFIGAGGLTSIGWLRDTQSVVLLSGSGSLAVWSNQTPRALLAGSAYMYTTQANQIQVAKATLSGAGKLITIVHNINSVPTFSGQGGLVAQAFVYTPRYAPVTYDRHVKRSSDDYAQALTKLLPRGKAWDFDDGSTLSNFISGVAAVMAYPFDANAAKLLEIESDPRQTLDLLPDWERNWGLPDPCITAPLTISDRQTILVQKMTRLGGQSRAFFIDVANSLGHTISISEFAPFMVGVSPCGDTRPVGEYVAPLLVANYNLSASFALQQITPPYELLDPGSGGINFNYDPTQTPTIGQPLVFVMSLTDLFGNPVTIDPNAVNNAGKTARTLLEIYQTGDTTNFITVDMTHVSVYATYICFTGNIIDIEGTTPWAPNTPVSLTTVSDQPGDYRWQIAAPEIRYYWTIHVEDTRLTWFRAGVGQAGVDPHLTISRAEDLECIINGPHGWKPAHTQVIFDYSGLGVSNPMSGTP